MAKLRVCALYPELLNIYADRGNLLFLQRRCAWRGIEFQLTATSLGATIDPAAHDLFYIGGGQDRDQRLCAEDLVTYKRAALHEAAGAGAVVLGICGGYQLLGRSYQLADGTALPGVELVDMETVRAQAERLVGNVTLELELAGATRTLVGFENHAGRTLLGSAVQPLGQVVAGHGNNGQDGGEGVRYGNIVGTYLHGPLLPKNWWFADWLICSALQKTPAAVIDLHQLDDTLEAAVHKQLI